MEESILHQLTVSGYAVLFGILAGLFFDLIRMLRTALCFSFLRIGKTEALFCKEWPLIGRIPQKKGDEKREIVVCFITDSLFWMVLSLGAVLFLFFFNDGIFRWFFALGTLCGFSAYYLSISRLVLLFFHYILFFLKLFFRYVLHFLSIPFIMLIRILKRVGLSFLALLRKGWFSLEKHMFLRRYTESTRQKLVDIIRMERGSHG